MSEDLGPVAYGRWQAEHQRLADRLTDLETRVTEQVSDLRGDMSELAASATRRKDRQWTLMLAFLTGLVLPLIVAATAALITARATP